MNLVVALTGASGSYAAKAIVERSKWPVTLIASKMGKMVYEQEAGPFEELEEMVDQVWQDGNLAATVSSGSVPTVGMIVAPCSANTLGKVSAGIADSLVSRSAHCHLKEGRRVVLCVREAPWSPITARNAASFSAAGGTVMPISPPYYMGKGRMPHEISVAEMIGFYADHVLALFGQEAPQTWADVRKWGKES